MEQRIAQLCLLAPQACEEPVMVGGYGRKEEGSKEARKDGWMEGRKEGRHLLLQES